MNRQERFVHRMWVTGFFLLGLNYVIFLPLSFVAGSNSAAQDVTTQADVIEQWPNEHAQYWWMRYSKDNDAWPFNTLMLVYYDGETVKLDGGGEISKELAEIKGATFMVAERVPEF